MATYASNKQTGFNRSQRDTSLTALLIDLKVLLESSWPFFNSDNRSFHNEFVLFASFEHLCNLCSLSSSLRSLFIIGKFFQPFLSATTFTAEPRVLDKSILPFNFFIEVFFGRSSDLDSFQSIRSPFLAKQLAAIESQAQHFTDAIANRTLLLRLSFNYLQAFVCKRQSLGNGGVLIFELF